MEIDYYKISSILDKEFEKMGIVRFETLYGVGVEYESDASYIKRAYRYYFKKIYPNLKKENNEQK